LCYRGATGVSGGRLQLIWTETTNRVGEGKQISIQQRAWRDLGNEHKRSRVHASEFQGGGGSAGGLSVTIEGAEGMIKKGPEQRAGNHGNN